MTLPKNWMAKNGKNSEVLHIIVSMITMYSSISRLASSALPPWSVVS